MVAGGDDFTPFEARVRELLVEEPELPARCRSSRGGPSEATALAQW